MTKMGKRTFLVLEDNRAIVNFIEYALSKLGYDWIVANSAQQALDELEQTWVDGIIMDINFGDSKSGAEFLDEIRNKAELNRPPAIAIAAHMTREERKTLLLEGFDGCLATPFKSRSLGRLLKRQARDNQRGPANRSDRKLERLFSETIKTLEGKLSERENGSMEQSGHDLEGAGDDLELRSLSSIGAQMTLAAESEDKDKLDRYIKEFEQLALQKTDEYIENEREDSSPFYHSSMVS